MDGGSEVDKRPAAYTSSLSAGMKTSELDGMGGGWTGTKKTKKLLDEQYHDGGGCAATNSPAVAVRSRKRPYEYNELEPDVSMEKLYKCNYWEDPAYAHRLQYFGLQYAREAALDNLCERLHREFEAGMAGRQQPIKLDAEDADANNNQ